MSFGSHRAVLCSTPHCTCNEMQQQRLYRRPWALAGLSPARNEPEVTVEYPFLFLPADNIVMVFEVFYVTFGSSILEEGQANFLHCLQYPSSRLGRTEL